MKYTLKLNGGINLISTSEDRILKRKLAIENAFGDKYNLELLEEPEK